MPRRPYPSFDYQYLSDALGTAGGKYELLYLSPAAFKALESLREVILWRETRWYNGTEQQIIDLSGQIYQELSVPLHLDDLKTELDEIDARLDLIISAIEAMEGSNIFQVACCVDPTPFPLPPGYTLGSGDPPAFYGDETPADWEDYEKLVCYTTKAFVDDLAKQLDDMRIATLVGGVGTGIVSAILGSWGAGVGIAAMLFSPGAVLAVTAGLLALASEIILSDAIADLEACKDDIAGAVACASTDQDAADALSASIEACVDPLAWAILQLWPFGGYANMIRTGEYEGESVNTGRCSATPCNTPLPPSWLGNMHGACGIGTDRNCKARNITTGGAWVDLSNARIALTEGHVYEFDDDSGGRGDFGIWNHGTTGTIQNVTWNLVQWDPDPSNDIIRIMTADCTIVFDGSAGQHPTMPIVAAAFFWRTSGMAAGVRMTFTGA